ncbi:MAG: PIN domain-containing protein [Flavobacteriaceae bacterium]|jgi:predicted nucleic acid-binding protein|nr:PIN domain-containing protein [Flavobacteriaceae bacterium]
MNLFIDTNIYLNFFHFSKDDITELEKLKYLLDDEKITIHLPQQTEDEFYRNREKIINNSINSLKEYKSPKTYPEISKNYTEFENLKTIVKEFEKTRQLIISKIINDTKENKLSADLLIRDIFNKSKKHKTTDILIQESKNRYDLGNPPGKGKSYGDALNWCTLLSEIKDEEDLYIISDDSDFNSILENTDLNPFLKEEWNKTKKAKAIYYNSLSKFLSVHFSIINLKDNTEKEASIKELSLTSNFAQAHARLSKLKNYNNFTIPQLNDIMEIVTNNNQFYWIKEDYGIGNVIREIVNNNYKESINQDIYERYLWIYEPEKIEITDEDILPF